MSNDSIREMRLTLTLTGPIAWPGWWVLSFLFITLKLTGQITWSWWWVLTPVWLPVAFAALGFTIAIIVRIFRTKDKP